MTKARNRQRKRQGGRRRGGQVKMLMAVGVATLTAIAALILLTGKDDAQPANASLLITDDSWQITSEGATVTVVEFLDFECEACRAAHPVVQQILQDYEGRISYVVRYFSNHTNSVLAAKAAEAAGEQGKYWEMYNKLFETQGQWGEKKEPQTQAFLRYAQELGLDLEAFRTSLASNAYVGKINRDKQDGIDAGVNATPTFFINGKKEVGALTYEAFEKRIEAELGN